MSQRSKSQEKPDVKVPEKKNHLMENMTASSWKIALLHLHIRLRKTGKNVKRRIYPHNGLLSKWPFIVGLLTVSRGGMI